MTYLERIYTSILETHFKEGLEMAFIVGPRQVGKTTLARRFQKDVIYLNWDNEDHRHLILSGPGRVAAHIGLKKGPIVVFDEIQKNPHWKTFIKGFYDSYGIENKIKIIVTGSARLDIFRKGGDSLMGRYFLYRMHPLSVAELISSFSSNNIIKMPRELDDNLWQRLIKHGGFPQPFLRSNNRFYNRWKRSRISQIFREDIYDISRVREIRLVELLADLVVQQAGQLTSYASLARKIRASEDSIRNWLGILESLYFCFSIRPWHGNIVRSLRKEPKYYLWDWAMVREPGPRNENMIASHLLKAVHFWTDIGIGEFGLYFLRTKDKKEVDFVVTRDGTPWFLVEVKSSHTAISPNLRYFQERIGALHAFQVTIDAPFVDADCFSVSYPVRVPAKTFLSQLV